MKAQDLMIWNFVYFNCFDGSKIVVHVTGFKDGIVYGDSEKGSHWCNIKKVEPIPISQEILEKNGFVKQWNNNWQLNDYHSIIISENFYIAIFELSTRLDYVHELQHAMRLAGIDKEIKL